MIEGDRVRVRVFRALLDTDPERRPLSLAELCALLGIDRWLVRNALCELQGVGWIHSVAAAAGGGTEEAAQQWTVTTFGRTTAAAPEPGFDAPPAPRNATLPPAA